MRKIVVLWALPRSTGTAFEVMMRERRDFFVLHEPFGASYYYGEDRRSHRAAHLPPQPKHNYPAVWHRLQQLAQHHAVFMKELPNHVMPLLNETFVSYFHHTFLIRHPAKVLPSYFDKIPDFTLEEVGFIDLCTLFDLVRNLSNTVPVVIDSDDLVHHPSATVKAYCEAIGIPFIPEALTWSPGPRPEISYWDGGSWHAYLKSSRSFKERSDRNYVRVEEHEHLRQAYVTCLPYYHKLYEQRLRIA